MRLRRVGIADDSDLLDGQDGSSFASGNAFGTVVVATQSDVVADASNDTLTLVAGTGITITTDAGADSITITNSSSGGVSDGDKGDITVSGSGATWTIDNDAVTFGKIQNITTDRILGRDTAASGDVEELRVEGGIEFTGGGAIQTSAFTGDVTKTAGGTSTTIANNAVTTAKIADGNVTLAKIANAAASSKLLGSGASGSGAPYAEITLGTNLSMSGTTLNATGGGSSWTNVILGSDFVSSSASNTNVTGLSFTPAASTTYLVEIHLLLRTAAAATGPRPGIAFPTGMTDSGAWMQAPNSVTASAQRWWGTTATANAASTGVPNTTSSWMAIGGALLIMGGSPSGDFQITIASETGGTNVTVKAGSFIRYTAIS